MSEKNLGFNTRTIHAGQKPDPLTGAVMTPIYQTSTYAQESPGKHHGFEYARTHNPTRDAYQACVASLEGGSWGLAFSSGLAATDAILHSVLQKGDHVLCCDDVYGGTFRIFDKVFKKTGVDFTFSDLRQLDDINSLFKKETKLLWIESPTNPLLKILNIKKLSDAAKKRGVITVVDNTFMSPYFQRPLELGATLVMHSVTKYLNGHSDVVGGMVIGNNSELYEKIKFTQNAVGAVPAPLDCFLVLRGIKTLSVRMKRHEENAIQLAQFLEKHPKVEKVIYPGLKSHPEHVLATEQMSGFGGMLSFYLKGDFSKTRQTLERFKLFTLAESLGGVESLVNHPATMTHASIPEKTRQVLGITDNLIRLSVGIEDYSDLKTDVDEALN